ncbi:GAP family protein [Streptomyces sp. NPDC058572]|uniref:GAP family protein n=1 Tax=Streptomyces sp. NPDC058572 TaxID=3346546 RepID=UPI00364B9FB8
MVLDLLLIALGITLDPLPIMAFVLVVASDRGVWKGLAFIMGWLACLVAVIALVLALTGGEPPPPRSPPSTAGLAARLVIGVALVRFALYRRKRMRSAPQAAPARVRDSGPEPDTAQETAGTSPRTTSRSRSSSSMTSRMDRSSPWAAAGLAVFLQPWGMVAAAAATVVSADLSHFSTYAALFGFCILATASLLAAELYVVFSPEAAQARLLKLRDWLQSHEQQAIVVICLLLGLWLTGQSIYELTS